MVLVLVWVPDGGDGPRARALAIARRVRRALLRGSRGRRRRRRRPRALAAPPPPLRVEPPPARRQGWWETFGREAGAAGEWARHFPVSQATFAQLVEALRGRLQQPERAAAPAEPLPAEKRVAVALFHLASGRPFGELAEHFGVEPSAVAGAVVQVCAAITEELLSKVVCLGPNVAE
ncbi:UNVERIFIED_CONTAM: hypothetical protein K2H54_042679 [Gekko kuhli]